MGEYALRLLEDRVGPEGGFEPSLSPCLRVVYVVAGSAAIGEGGEVVDFGPNSAWFGTGPGELRAGSEGARLWRWELVPQSHADPGLATGPGVASAPKQSDRLELEPQPRGEYLMRCDRVDFPIGGVAYTHTHAGPGTRCLLRGELRVQVANTDEVIRPGGSWFERGLDPVYAAASQTELTSFVRAMVLPRSLQGQSSIRYVRSEDRDRPKTQEYTRFVDEFIEL